ncbi:phage integrase:Chain length determinant protein [gamma proteobacterium NOR5-3]|nr:phage integrase:Chain length determinant protein [gamma proteobacterium NOR5-3]
MAFGMNTAQPSLGAENDDLAHGRSRRRFFTLSALTVLIIGLLYTAVQPAVYQSSATVLMSAPTAIDEQMLDADVQGVAIQRRTLTGSEITRDLAQRLTQDFAVDLDPLELRRILDVVPVPETNLLELTATGAERELLPPLVETWIEVYSSVRSRDIENRKSQTLTEVQDELDGLAGKLASARLALEEYRAKNEIISMERQENAVLAQLDGLNTSLNNAVEEEVRSKSYLDTLRASLSAGEQVVPQSERSDVAAMSQQLAELKSRLGELRARYTEDYIRKDPRLREIPDQVEKLELALGQAYARGTQAELNNAEREYAAARESVANLTRRLDEHKKAVADFNTIYATHQALVEDLARLEELNRETQARQVQIQVRQVDKYPQVSVIDWPAPEAPRIGPPYLMLLGGTLLAALGAGIFGAWLYSYLHPRSASPAYVTLTGVHMYPQDAAQALEQIPGQAARLQASGAARLSHSDNEITDGDETTDDEAEADPEQNPDPSPDPNKEPPQDR